MARIARRARAAARRPLLTMPDCLSSCSTLTLTNLPNALRGRKSANCDGRMRQACRAAWRGRASRLVRQRRGCPRQLPALRAEGHYRSLTRWTRITNLPLSTRTVERVMHAGRSRWQIEKETFNTLKKQGSHFEHNYGHETQNLATVLAVLGVAPPSARRLTDEGKPAGEPPQSVQSPALPCNGGLDSANGVLARHPTAMIF